MVFAHTMRPQPSVPRLYGALGGARRDPRRHREAQNARSFAATSSASDLRGTPGAPSWTKLELEIGFGDFEHLAASPFAFSGNVRDLSGRSDCRPGKCPNSGRERDSLIRAKISLIARFNSLSGRKKFPVRMRRELARKKLISCHFSLLPRRRQAPNRRNSRYYLAN